MKERYEGINGGMEVAGILAIFNYIIESYVVKYTQYLGDSDSKGYKKILGSQHLMMLK